jgi:hypothetical protein
MGRKPFACLAVVAALLVGCSDAPDIARVTGHVTRNGQPVAGATLNFMPENGRPSWAVTDAEGKYELHYSKEYEGALVGKHKVFVVFRPADPKEEAEIMAGRLKRPADQDAIMAKYGKWDTTPLEVEIKESGQVVDLKLD